MKLYEPFQFLTTKECDEIIAYGNKGNIRDGLVGRDKMNKSVRNNRLVWYEESKYWKNWIDQFNSVENKIDWIQTPQIAFYKPGEQYNWHVDTWPNYRTHIRHFTLTCELQSAPEGGLELRDKGKFDLQKGEAVLFRPQDEHRAVSPSSGERISFTIWAMTKNLNKVD